VHAVSPLFLATNHPFIQALLYVDVSGEGGEQALPSGQDSDVQELSEMAPERSETGL
jgi:hypothetical protein